MRRGLRMAVSPAYRHLSLVLLWLAMAPVMAQQSGESVRIRGSVSEDVYAAGGSVDVDASVDGDVVAAGGRVSIRDRVSGDVMAVGGAVTVDAEVGDDARLAGGDVTLDGTVGDDVIAAGGSVTLSAQSRTGGRAWLSGGRVHVAGSVGRELKAAAGRIVISGNIDGDVELAGRDIEILDGAIINGNLSYRSPQEAHVADGALVRGSVEYQPVEPPTVAAGAGVALIALVTLVSVAVTGIALYLLFPRTIDGSMASMRAEFWKCLGLGLAVFAATPVVIAVLLMTVVGWLVAVVIGPLYLILLLAGYLTGIFFAGDILLRLIGRQEATRGSRLWSFVLALVVVSLLALVPVLGALLVFALMLLGAGVLGLHMHRIYSARSAT